MNLDALRHDLAYSLRQLRRAPGFAATVALTLALGIGATTAMFGIIDRLLLRAPEHIADPDRVVQIHTARLGATGVQTSQPYSLYKELASGVTDFESAGIFTAGTYPLGRGESAMRVSGAQVTPSLFTTLGVRPQLGRFFQDDEAGEVNPQKLAVIGHGFWQRQFAGSAGAIGQVIELGVDRYTIVGVAPRGFTGPELSDVDVFIPIAAADGLRFVKGPEWTTVKSSQWLYIYGRLKPGATEARALAQASAAYRAYERAWEAEVTRARFRSNPDSVEIRFGSVIPGRSPGGLGLSANSNVVKVSRLLAIVSLLVLLLACANVANLLLVRALNRRREIAVRLALGVSRGRLVLQLLLEGLMLALLGAAGALAVVYFGSGAIRRLLMADAAWTGSAIDVRVLVATGVTALVTAVLTSLLPVVQSTRPNLTRALRAGVREGIAGRSVARSALLATQTALALLLLTGAGLFLRSLQRAANQPFGVDINKVVTASIQHRSVGMSNAEAKELYLRFAERARGVPGVSASAVSIAHSFGLGWGTRVAYRGEALTLPNQGFAQYAVTPGYFEVMGVRLRSGRLFSDADREGAERVAIINETAARSFWPNGDAIGSCITVGADSMPCTTVIGVVTNSRRQQLVEGPIPQVYRPLAQLGPAITDGTVSFFGYTLLARAERPDVVVEPLRRVIQATAPSVPFANVRTLASQFGRQTRAWTLGASMFTIFGVLALALATMGLYSVVVFTMAQRVHEYGVRRALGASGNHLVWITMVRGLVPATLGLLVGVALALAAGRVVASLLFETSPREPAVFAAVSALLLGAAAVACLLPSLRAARTDPVVALRSD